MESPEKVAAGRHATKDSVHVDRLDRLRADGNAAFKAGNLQAAKRHYTAAISLAESMPDEPVEKLVPTRRAQLLANRCQVSLALEKVAEALSDAQVHPHRTHSTLTLTITPPLTLALTLALPTTLTLTLTRRRAAQHLAGPRRTTGWARCCCRVRSTSKLTVHSSRHGTWT